MKCISCSKEIPSGNVYCPLCGKEAQIISDNDVFEEDFLKTLLGDEPESKSSNSENSEINKPKTKNSSGIKKKKKFLVLLIMIIIIIAVFCMMYYLKQNSYETLYNKAEISYHTGKYEDAVEYAVKSLDKEPSSIDSYLLLGASYEHLGEIANAENCYFKVLDMDVSNLDAYKNLLDLYNEAGDYSAIESVYNGLSTESSDVLKLFEDYLISVPETSIKGGTYSEIIEIELSAEKDYTIYYTLDGTTPSASSALYEEPIKLKKEGTFILQAVCADEKGNLSSAITETYVIEFAIPEMPSIYPDGGVITESVKITMAAEDNTVIYYTWDGSKPDKSSDKYTEPVEVPEGNNILSVVAIDKLTGECSEVFKTNFIYYPSVETLEEDTVSE